MKYKHEVLKEIELLELPIRGLEKITDLERVSELQNLIYQNKTLPENIQFKLRERKKILDDLDFKKAEILPQYVIKREEVIEDLNELKIINDFVNKNFDQLPEGVLKYKENYDGVVKTMYCKINTEAYYISEYSFYEEYLLTEQELEFQLKVKSTKELTHIASILFFFQVMVILGVIITIVALFILFVIGSF